MRPLLLEMQGFSAFRESTTVDFRDHNLIALTGPTGAGKSTIIDGIVFALYGSVARYDNEKLVAPVINAVSTEARIRLEFSLGDDVYTVVRVVRRTAKGASTKEARLEQGDRVLASTAQEVTEAVEELLGLSFNQFTKTVVLPQGDFARFLTEKAGSRQKLLRRLLGLDVFAEVGKTARARARVLHSQAQVVDRELKRTPTVTDAELARLSAVIDGLDAALDEMAEASAERKSAALREADAADRVRSIDEHLHALSSLKMPAASRTYASKMTKAEERVSSRKAKLDAAAEKHTSAIEACSELPSPDEIATMLDLHKQHSECMADVERLTGERVAAAKKLDQAAATTEQAAHALAASEEAVEHARVLLGASGIRATLHDGDTCPVCEQLVGPDIAATSSVDHDDAVTKAEAARSNAREAAKSAMAELQDATARDAGVHAQLDAANAAAAQVADQLDGVPSPAKIAAIAKKVDAATKKVVLAAERVDAAAVAHGESLDEMAALQASVATMRRHFTEARDSVSALGPPKPSEDALDADWRALIEWANEAKAAQKQDRQDAASAAKTARDAWEKAGRAMAALSRPVLAPGATADPETAEAALRNAHADARVVVANAQDRRARQLADQEQMDTLEVDRRLADELGKHFVSGAFERWIMADVMLDLAERASIRLAQLSGDAYSLTTDGQDFQIRDHRNADELRNARTLSGGETFLTSLSLALALAESITELASTHTPPLESMFLDEGFGTLDAETLDTVAGAIEELGASGRMIGVVTHIQDLADRIPTRFEVKRGPAGSRVTAAE